MSRIPSAALRLRETHDPGIHQVVLNGEGIGRVKRAEGGGWLALTPDGTPIGAIFPWPSASAAAEALAQAASANRP